ncbi:MAG: 5-(carboxyamino)imidazole ribonucleotide synthase [Ignavibacteria bacterium]|nr:5-(carboxyamino)imidazole ribonucleotide synthase [Ignavibacteria bacterium]
MKVGILGGGQLGRMLALAGYPLGLRFRFLDPSLHVPAGHLVEHTLGMYDDTATLDRFAQGLDLVTYEFENVPVDAVHHLARQVPVFPPASALEIGQDRLQEKIFFQQCKIPTPPFASIDSRESLDSALERIGYPSILKTRRFGYDGKGQWMLSSKENATDAWKGLRDQSLILEGFIPFEKEMSIIAVRASTGETAFYPPIENYHREGILRLSIAPIQDKRLQEEAEEYARRVLDKLHYVGVLAIEFFVYEGKLFANEMAPRVHNSGHWTIEGAETSQFENHLRAILGLPLGLTTMNGHAAMVNLIGTVPERENVLHLPDAHLHLYGKEPRPGRKLGHVTLTAKNRISLEGKLRELFSDIHLEELAESLPS